MHYQQSKPPARSIKEARQILSGSKSVLFIAQTPTIRAFKLAWGLRQAGWKVGYIYQTEVIHSPLQYFDVLLKAPSPEALYSMAVAIAPTLCHVFTHSSDAIARRFCTDKIAPVIIDFNDVNLPSLLNGAEWSQEPTRELLALAEGFCARDRRAIAAHEIGDTPLPPHVVLFPEYCWNLPRENTRSKFPPDEVHVVNVGSFTFEKLNQYECGHLWIAKHLAGLGIHFHIYASFYVTAGVDEEAAFRETYSDFLELAEQTPYVHVYKTVSNECMEDTLAGYDFGLFTGGCHTLHQHGGLITPLCYDNCFAGRVANYLDARLPVLINRELKFGYETLDSLGMAINAASMLDAGFKKKLLDIKTDPTTRATAERAAQEFSIARSTDQLAAFYANVLAGGVLDLKYDPTPYRTSQAASGQELAASASPNQKLDTFKQTLKAVLPPAVVDLLRTTRRRYHETLNR
jgi:hypothetical protein